VSDVLGPADAPDPRGVLVAFGLDGVVTGYDEVAGGWSNRVLRLRTTHGDYAVKELRNAWGEPRWLEWLAEGWRVERAVRAAGVRAPEPVPGPGGACLAQVERTDGSGEAPVRLHRWVEGAAVAREPVEAALAAWVGGALAAQHALALQPLTPGLYAGRAGLTTADVWPDLVGRAQAAGAAWAARLAAASGWAQRATDLLEQDDAAAVLVHGDVDQKNLLVATDGPLLLDWDVVLPVVPAHDLAHAAVTMAGWREPAVAAAVVHGYRDAGGVVEHVGATDLGPALASRLGWIRFTVDRVLAARAQGSPTPADENGIPALLDDLERRVRLAETWPAWLSTARE
jgi:aminoglycoside phosphotransferase (APT) family kinase protein